MTETPGQADIVFATAETQNGNVERMIVDLRAGFDALNFVTADFHVDASTARGDMEAMLAAHPDAAVLSMNIYFPYLNMHADLLADRAVFLYALDPPVYFLDSVASLLALPRCFLGLNSLGYGAFVDTFVPDARHHFMPHGANVRDAVAWEDRDVPVFFCGNRPIDPDATRAGWAEHGAEFEAVLNRMADAQLANPAGSVFDMVRALMPERFATDLTRIFGCMFLVDEYTRAKFRDDLLSAMTDIEVHVFGAGWAPLAEKAGRMKVHGPLDAPGVQETMARARIVLNLVPPCYDSHERLFDAMAAGAAIGSPSGAFLRRSFGTDGFVPLAGPEAGAEALRQALADDDATRALAERTHRKFLDGHTWTHRARAVADILKL